MTSPPPILKDALAERYDLEREIGRGGTATVYLAQDLRHNRQVAVKIMPEDLTETLGADRFLQEIEIAAKLNHPHILPLLDSANVNGGKKLANRSVGLWAAPVLGVLAAAGIIGS
jgi:serine/threonine protein kinase